MRGWITDRNAAAAWCDINIALQLPESVAATVQRPRSTECNLEEGDASTTRCSRSVDLPLHLTEKILCCMCPIESARLGTVCRSWAATVSDRLASSGPHLFLTETVFVPPDDNNVSTFTCERSGLGSMVSIPLLTDSAAATGASPPVPAPDRVANLVRCLSPVGATANGHPSFEVAGSIVLANPVTDALRLIDMGNGSWRRTHGGDTFVSYGSAEGTALWRQAAEDGYSAAWSKLTVAAHRHQRYHVFAAVSCNGCVYVLNRGGSVYKVNTRDSPPLDMKFLPVPRLPSHFPRWNELRLDLTEEDGHLLSVDGEVLFVRRLLDDKEIPPGDAFCDHDEFLDVVGFEVYRLDELAPVRRGWTKVEALGGGGDWALFVSHKSSFAVRASDTGGCRSNCIYFVGENRHCSRCRKYGGRSWGVYSVD